MRDTPAFYIMLLLISTCAARVDGSNIVDMDHMKQFNMYIGQSYIGSKFREEYMVYDTLSDWTIISYEYPVKTSETHQ